MAVPTGESYRRPANLIARQGFVDGLSHPKGWAVRYDPITHMATARGPQGDGEWYSITLADWVPTGKTEEEHLGDQKKKRQLLTAMQQVQLSMRNFEGTKSYAMVHISRDPHRAKLTWGLGPGPCGRTVLNLGVSLTLNPGFITVVQWCLDKPSEPDEFLYATDTVEAMRLYRTDNPNPADNPKENPCAKS